ncbi:MAG: lipopolysaccharide biosynthesis protein [Xanthobacteraceae bacterium]|nr:lipopolysaccharide biosynthesis protein [Xanthobacteraceae bacterium]
MNDFITRKLGRVAYYARAGIRDALPYPLYRRRLRRLYDGIAAEGLSRSMIERVNYYNRLTKPAELREDMRARDIPLEATYYYYDLKEHLNYFPRDIRIRYKFGDLNWLLDSAAVCKSRPIGGESKNSVLLKLDKFRHFRWMKDPHRFADKQKAAVWRGGLQNPLRKELVKVFRHHPRHNIGHVGSAFEGIEPREWMSMQDQLSYRYMLSIEGYDVATNLKTVLASQSLCLMPPPTCETWFMEGRLVPGLHYVELRKDFADLEEKIDYYDRHEAEAEAIVATANRHVAQFANRADEDLIAILVLQKYFEAVGELPPELFSDAFWTT